MAELKKQMGFLGVLSLAMGGAVGTGMFLGQSLAASTAGVTSILSWLIMAGIGLYIASCFGELASMFPKSGGVYEFGKQTYGRFGSFLLGWVTWLVGNISIVVLIVAAIDYLLPSTAYPWAKVAISMFFIIVLNVITLIGIEASSLMMMAFAAITLTVLLALIIGGGLFVKAANYAPLFAGSPLMVFVAIFFIAETFFGWEGATFLAEETENAERVIPRAIMTATFIGALLALAVTVVTLGVIPVKELSLTAAPLKRLSEIIFSSFPEGVDVISIGVYLTLLGSAASAIVTMPRLMLAMARDKLFLSQFKNVNDRFKTPHVAIIFQTVFLCIVLLMAVGTYQTLLSLLVPLALLMYIPVVLSVPILRHTKPALRRPFKAPFGRTGPLLVVLFFLAVIVAWVSNQNNAANQLMLSCSFILLGFPLYLLVELYYDPKMITSVHDLFAYFTLATERIWLPESVRRQVLQLVGEIGERTVLEFGCSVGTLTVQLLKAVGPGGTVIATGFSTNDLKITKKRIERINWESSQPIYGQIQIIHDIEHMNRVHPDITYADAAVSVGVLGYLQDVKKVLREVSDILPSGGKICFVEYSDFFKVIPNVEWLSKDSNIERIFRECGFSVQVIRRKGIFWSYVYIYGMKFGYDVPYI